MSKRQEHRFHFRGSQISEAAQAESEYHRERAAFWKGEYEKAVAAAKSSGVEIREYDVTGGKRADIVVDVTHQARLTEARNKIQTHVRLADEFRIQAMAYGTHPDKTFDLDCEDVIYFRLAGGERDA